MSLHVAAKHLASKGRKGDTELVHMTKGEIKGLQDLALAHGGSLSINPDTGLVEASFLKRILPMIAGAGLMMIPGVGPLAAAGMVGGFETLRTGDISKGLMAGLGAYGGAGIAGSLSTAGAAAAGDIGIQATSAGAENLGANALKESAGAALSTPIPGIENAGANALRAGVQAPVNLSNMGAGFNQVTSSPEALGQFGKQNLMNIGAAATPALNDAMTPKPIDPMAPEKSSGEYISKDFKAYVPNQPNPYYRPQGLGYTGYAMGGMVDPMQQMPNGGLAALQGQRDGYGAPSTQYGNIPQFKDGGKLSMREVEIKSGIFKDTNPNTASLGADEAAEYYVRNAAKRSKVPYTKMPKTSVAGLGNIEVGPIKQAATGGSIGGYSDGGRMLKGPGDGMSDSIPGVISNKQPARLADGEFVVPADVVSHLGNGSTDAGAKRLYAMMDKVRKARTGNKKQGKQIKPEKYMPA